MAVLRPDSKLSREAADLQVSNGNAPTGARHGWLKLIPLAIGLVILGAVIIVGLKFGEARQVFDLARKASPPWLILAASLQFLTYLCSTAVWRQVLKRVGHAPSIRQLLPLGIAKLFTDQAIPTGGISGAMLVVRGLVRRDVPSSVAMTALLIGFVTYYTAYLLIVVSALVVLGLHHRDSAAILIASTIFAGYVIGVPALVIWLTYRRRQLPSWVRKLPGVRRVIESVKGAPVDLLKSPKLIAEAVALQASIFLLDATTLWVMFQAIGHGVAPWIAFVAFVMASVTATLTPVPFGLGTFEAGSVAFLHLLGVPIAEGLAATLLLRGFTFWLPMLPGLWFARRELAAAHKIPSDSLPGRSSN